MDNLLVKCPHCNCIYKIIDAKKEDNKFIFITDMNGKLKPNENFEYTCIKCKGQFNILEHCMKTEDWIANLVFEIKGN